MDFAARLGPDFGFAVLALVLALVLAFTLRAGFLVALRLALPRARAALFFFPLATFFVVFRFFAMTVFSNVWVAISSVAGTALSR